MRLHFAFLARYANIDTDGTFGVLGGGILYLRAVNFPVAPYLTFFAQILLSPEERRKENRVRLEIYNQEGQRAPNDWEIPIPPQADVPNELLEWETPFSCLFYLAGMAFPQPGVYRFRVICEAGQVGEDFVIPVVQRQ